MYKILVGLVFISVNYYMNFDGLRVGILPDFIGYFLIGLALKEFEDEATHFKAARGSVRVMMIVSIVMYILEIIEIIHGGIIVKVLGGMFGVTYMAIELVYLVMYAYITYLITLGMQEIEYDDEMDDDGLMTAWKWVFGTKAFCYCCILISGYLPYLSQVTTVAVLVALAFYMIQFFKCAKRY